MQVIARIPDVTATPASGPARAVRLRDGAGGPAWQRQAWPVAALAAAAAAAWVLASWNEHLRLERQRGELRVARETVSAPGFAPPVGGGGAVVR